MDNWWYVRSSVWEICHNFLMIKSFVTNPHCTKCCKSVWAK
jgi:hypothetical protein